YRKSLLPRSLKIISERVVVLLDRRRPILPVEFLPGLANSLPDLVSEHVLVERAGPRVIDTLHDGFSSTLYDVFVLIHWCPSSYLKGQLFCLGLCGRDEHIGRLPLGFLDATARQIKVLRVHLNTDELPPERNRRNACRCTPHEGIQHSASDRRNYLHERPHETNRLLSWMLLF